MAKIPQNVIDEVRNSVDIGDVIGHYVQLHQAGKNLTGLCPFHDEKTPSFSVNEEKQFFYCFGCGRGGNVFQFLMELKHIDFVEAVKEVANDGGVALAAQYTSSPKEHVDNSEQHQLIELHQKAAKLYHHILLNTPAGEPARRYLSKRGMSTDLIETFNLGYAPDQQLLKPYFEQEQVDYQLMRKTGLFGENQQGALYDRFVDRIIYPIKNSQGQIVAFSGRLLDTTKTDLPKYLNSPETLIFNKRKTLFNYDIARKDARKLGKMFLFEGFMDVISAYGAGVTNGIASMGTSFTEEQVHIINRSTAQLDLCYDGDEPGQNAIDRAIQLIQDQRVNLQLRVVQLPAGIDPDEYVQKYGHEKFKSYLANHEETPVDFYLRFLRNGKNLANQQTLIAYLDQALKVIARVNAPLEEEMYLQKLADEFKLDKITLKGQLDQVRQQLGFNPPKQSHQYRRAQENHYESVATIRHEKRSAKISRTELAEQILLRYMLYDREVWAHVTANDQFNFTHERYQTLYLLATSYFTEHSNYSAAEFLEYINDPELRGTLGQIEQLNVEPQVEMQVVDDCIKILTEQTPLAQQIADKQAQLKEASALNNTELATQLTIELVKLLQRQQQLKTEETN